MLSEMEVVGRKEGVNKDTRIDSIIYIFFFLGECWTEAILFLMGGFFLGRLYWRLGLGLGFG